MIIQTSLNAFLYHPMVQAIGWALLHFLWQGTLLAAILFLTNALTKSSPTRYAVGCIAMLAMPVVFTATALRNSSHPSPVASAALYSAEPTVDGALSSTEAHAITRSQDGGPAPATRAMLPGWLVCLWLAGIALLSINTIAGWLRVRRLRTCGLESGDPVWIETLQRVMQALQMSRPVRLYQSAIAEVPAVVGWVRPYILLTASAVTGLEPTELRAILAHELAHIRRCDYLVNLLQNVIETLLFYHPAVWWLSRCIRQEREQCCDDVAVAVCGDVNTYAGALVRLEELRGSGFEPALAATGGDLLARIRRLTMPGSERGTGRPAGSAGVVMAVALVTVACICAENVRASHAQKPPAPEARVESVQVMAVQPQAQPVQPEPKPRLMAQVRSAPPSAQKSAEPPPEFDAASVKVDTSGFKVGFLVAMRGGPGTSDPGVFSITRGQPLKMMIAKAWNVPVDQVFGPSWLDDMTSNRYTISATMPPDTSKERFLLMWQNLLIERFHLALHHETRDFPGYDLVVATGGPKVKPWVADPYAAAAAAANPANDPQNFVRSGPQTVLRAPVNPGNDARGFPILGAGAAVGLNVVRHEESSLFLETHRQSMADFAKELAPIMTRAGAVPSDGPMPRVSDQTGLSGVYEFRFQYEGNLGGVAGGADLNSGQRSIFTEIQDQLGLKIVKANGVPVDVLVIDHAEKVPTGN